MYNMYILIYTHTVLLCKHAVYTTIVNFQIKIVCRREIKKRKKSQVEGYQNILKLSCRPLAISSYKVTLKHEKRSEFSPPTSFFA